MYCFVLVYYLYHNLIITRRLYGELQRLENNNKNNKNGNHAKVRARNNMISEIFGIIMNI